LTATTHVYRTNELVMSSRQLIEELAILTAKNAYARRALDHQVAILNALHHCLVDAGGKVSDEFDATIADLDKAHARLDKTLVLLKKTIVSDRQDLGGEVSNEDAKTLFDFIDESTHETLLTDLRALIDSYNDARSDLNADLSNFSTTLQTTSDKLASSNVGLLPAPQPNKPSIYDAPPPSIPQLFRHMEEHATEMASLLENLVNHYDLCVTALKHTEGGGEAARAAIQQQSAEDLKPTSTPGSEDSLYHTTTAAATPLSPAERTEMLAVLTKDAAEVDDVVTEIRDRATEVADLSALLSATVRRSRQHRACLAEILAHLRLLRATIPARLDAAARFRDHWTAVRADMRAKTGELEGLAVFYERFAAGYGKLLREVERRQASEAAQRRIAEKARKELGKLFEADRRARAEFMEDVGVFLPRDLGVWYGLEDGGVRWEVGVVEAERGTEGGGGVD
jgi:autophagy-related protein 17